MGIFLVEFRPLQGVIHMKLNKIIKTAIKYGPIVYPIIKKFVNNRSATKSTTTSSTPKK